MSGGCEREKEEESEVTGDGGSGGSSVGGVLDGGDGMASELAGDI